ncbi:MAG: hypothetical protein ABW182_11935 [Sphingomonas sp.]
MSPLAMLAGSVGAIFMLAGAAWALRLGGARIADADEALRTAEDIVSGFEAERAIVASDGQAAIVHGRDGSIVVLKVHGAHIAGRRLARPVEAVPVPDGLRIATGERRFGTVTLRGVTEF